MGLINILLHDPAAFFVLVFLLLYSIIFHEVAHGAVANLFGDSTARYSGRLTLNPRVHVDPIGSLMLLFVGFGWAKPVPVSYAHLKPFRIGLIAVACAGCFVNILIATIAVFLLQFPALSHNRAFAVILVNMAKINIALGAFNLIPIPPLDGSKILMGFLPARLQYAMARFESFGYVFLIILIVTSALDPVITFFYNGILAFILWIINFL